MSFDVCIVGSGLAGSLLAQLLERDRPELSVAIVDPQFGELADKTWCAFEADLMRGPRVGASLDRSRRGKAHDFLVKIGARDWQSHWIAMDRQPRHIPGGYYGLKGSSLASAMANLKNTTIFRSSATRVDSNEVESDAGEIHKASYVIDARGSGSSKAEPCGFQKFLGLELRLERDHGQKSPMIMDARVAQHDGFRFVYTLPWEADRILVEDTYYSNTKEIDKSLLRKRVLDYCDSNGWVVSKILREESASLPIPLYQGDVPKNNENPEIITIGYRGKMFNATTGYSFGEAFRVANWLSEVVGIQPREALFSNYRLWQKKLASQNAFLMRLNNMMFLGALPEERKQIMRQFYSRSDGLIERFYSNELTWSDKLRCVSGRPPIPILKGVKAFMSNAASYGGGAVVR